VDPIADKFPHVSTFNYAENRPISGIDLWGLQYVDANSSFYQIATGQVWVKTNSFQSGRDAFGQNYIGTAVPLSRFGLTRSDGSSFPAIRGGANDLRNIGNNLGRMFEASGTTSLGNLDNSARAYQKASNQAVGLGKVGLSLVALWFGPLLLGLFYRRILTNRVHKNNFVPAQTTDGELYAERQVKGKHFRRLGCFSLFHSFLS